MDIKSMNPALQTSFLLEIPAAPELNYHIQNCELPGLTMAGVDTPFKNHQASVPSNRIEFDQLTLSFLVDEQWKNWEFIFNWMKNIRTGKGSIQSTMSDITLNLVNSNKNLNQLLVFHDAYPTFLSALSLDSATVEATPLQASLTFRFQDYELKRAT